MAEAALKIEPFTMSVRRVGMPDIADKSRFLCERLKERWPHLQDRFLLGWLQGLTGSNEYLFIRYDKAIGLFQRVKEFTDRYPRVYERFVIAELDTMKHPKGSEAESQQKTMNDIAISQAAELYSDAFRWAQSIGAAEIDVDHFTDVPVKDKDNPDNPDTIKARLGGRLFQEAVLFAKVGS